MKCLASKLLHSFATQAFDVAVIGGGPGGYSAAIKAGQVGLKAVCIDKRGVPGGTCLNVGCIPSKTLLHVSHKYHEAQHSLDKMGIHIQNVSFDFAKMHEHKNSIVKSLNKGIEGLFAKNKVAYMKGTGSFESPSVMQANPYRSVHNNDGSHQVIEAKHTIIATGSDSAVFPGLPFDEKVVISSTGALALPQVPKHLIVIGGGVIGLELGSVYQRLGSKVTVIEFFEEICPTLDREIASTFNKILTKQGMKILTSHKVVSVKNKGDSAEVVYEPVKGGPAQTITGEHVLVSIGRRPFTSGLQLEKAGIKTDEKGRVVVDDQLRTAAQNVYAIGDVIRGPMLAHKSEEEGLFAVEHIQGKHPHMNYNSIPSVVYTHPEIAMAGHTEEELKAKSSGVDADIAYNKGVFPFLANSRAKAVSQTEGLVKILADKKTDKLLGAHIIGSGAGEMISEAVIGLEYGASSEDLGRTCHSHPTLSEAFKEACMATYGKPIHF